MQYIRIFLSRKVFKKLHFELADDVIKQVVNCKPFVIERVLLMLRTKIDNIIWEKHSKQQNEQPEADQYKHGMCYGGSIGLVCVKFICVLYFHYVVCIYSHQFCYIYLCDPPYQLKLTNDD